MQHLCFKHRKFSGDFTLMYINAVFLSPLCYTVVLLQYSYSSWTSVGLLSLNICHFKLFSSICYHFTLRRPSSHDDYKKKHSDRAWSIKQSNTQHDTMTLKPSLLALYLCCVYSTVSCNEQFSDLWESRILDFLTDSLIFTGLFLTFTSALMWYGTSDSPLAFRWLAARPQPLILLCVNFLCI